MESSAAYGAEPAKEAQFVGPKQLSNMMRSKIDIYDFLRFQCGYVLPVYKKCPLHFLRDCLSKRKQLIKASEVVKINVPQYEELSVKNLYERYKDDDPICQFLPDYSTTNELPDREFFYSVFSTVYPHYMEKITQDALKFRHSQEGSAKDELIEIHPDIYQELESKPVLTKKKGRGVFLLKQGASIYSKRRKRRECPSLTEMTEELRKGKGKCAPEYEAFAPTMGKRRYGGTHTPVVDLPYMAERKGSEEV